jgi:hypothetical protein
MKNKSCLYILLDKTNAKKIEIQLTLHILLFQKNAIASASL